MNTLKVNPLENDPHIDQQIQIAADELSDEELVDVSGEFMRRAN